MDRSRYSGGPSRNPPPTWSAQDARSGVTAQAAANLAVQPPSNLAIQPAANAGGIKLKKKTVKIVGRSAPDSTPAATSTAATFPASANTAVAVPAVKVEPATDVIKPNPNSSDRQEDGKTKPAMTLTMPESANTTSAVPKSNAEASLDAMFARLSAGSPSDTPKAPPGHLEISMFKFDEAKKPEDALGKDIPEAQAAIEKVGSLSKPQATESGSKPTFALEPTVVASDFGQSLRDTTNLPLTVSEKTVPPKTELNETEREYLRKAAEYVSALPAISNSPVKLIQAVTAKLQSTHTPDIKLDPKEADRLKARIVFAIVNFINQKVKMSATPLTAEKVKGMLHDNNGNFLFLCGTLVEENYMSLENLDHVVGLCNMIFNALPKADYSAQPPSTPSTAGVSQHYEDPMDKMKSWPTQEKREDAVFRTATMKGINGMRLCDITSLIWGGALESLTISSNNDLAIVKFLTPAACNAYLDATANGIIVPESSPRKVVFIDKQPSPSSVNDVIQKCIENGMTRCIRASGADEGWSDAALMKLAAGTEKVKRSVERVKQIKNATGVLTVEFYFSNIYDALNFRRQLVDDVDWEHCNVQYMMDPCEMAGGIHLE